MKPKTDEIKRCQRCQKEFHIHHTILDSLCQECIETLPKCYVCGIICGQEWGYFESSTAFTLKKGKKVTLCGSCSITIRKKGYLLFNGAKAIKKYSIGKEGEIIRRHRRILYYRRRLHLDGTFEWVAVPDFN